MPVFSVLSRNQNVIFMAYLLSFGFFVFVSLHVKVIAIGVGIQYFGGNLGRPALASLERSMNSFEYITQVYKLKTLEYFLSSVAITIVLSLKCFIYTCLNPLVTAHSFRVYFHKTIPERAQVIHSRTTTQDCHLRTHQL